MIWILPLLATAIILGVLALSLVHRRVNLFVSRIALSTFGDYVVDSTRANRQRDRMRAAHTGGTHRVYAARTLFYAAVFAVVGSVLGVYLAAGLLVVMEVNAETIQETLPGALAFLAELARLSTIEPLELFVLLLASSATIGTVLAVGIYTLRWGILENRASSRAAAIDATLPRTVAFIYALSRSGMALPAVLKTLAENEDVYGEAATELAVAVRDMNTFGTDVLTALRRTARHTPSENLEEFTENLASVLGSGRSLPEYLHKQYERYQAESESQQEQYLELLSTFAEAYVTVLVAGPLFFITIFVVVGLVLQNTIPILRVIIYAGIPLATAGFVVYVDSVTRTMRTGLTTVEKATDAIVPGRFTVTTASTDRSGSNDGAVADRYREQYERMEQYDRLRHTLGWVRRPGELLLRRPIVSLAVTLPIGVVWIWASATPIPVDSPIAVVRAVDDAIVQSTILAGIVYASLYEIEKRRTRRMESAVPDFLDRLASINEAGMTIVESVERVAQSDLDELTPELKRTWRDVRWGSDVESALYRFERRIRSPIVSRSVALIVNAMRASGDVAPVLSIAAEETRASRRLQRERRQVMMTYLIVIYISFFVFLGIIASLTLAFIPAIEQAAEAGVADGGGGVPAGASVGGIADGFGDVDIASYELVFYHGAVIQGICSGAVAGQLGEGDLRDGVKHAVILLVLTYVSVVSMGLV
ncbi:type II secretion system F family protein [Halopenitus sp. H-Gu1]|uniref:type II secretion system F family protein n=1 Tax=Halopenitus sp. H-Gu1 TaxID=3242697 RepID=UPI00359D8331